MFINYEDQDMGDNYNPYSSQCIFITAPFGLNLRSCLLSESENPTYRSYVLKTCISN